MLLNTLPQSLSLKLNPFSEDGARDDIDKVDGKMIRTFLSEFAAIPHMAGLEADELLAVQLKQKWIELGLDQVKLKIEFK